MPAAPSDAPNWSTERRSHQRNEADLAVVADVADEKVERAAAEVEDGGSCLHGG